MKETPLVHIGLRVERSTFRLFNKIVKEERTTRSGFMRDLLNREINSYVTYEQKPESESDNVKL